MNRSIQPLLVGPAEAAALLGVSRSTIYELVHLGVLPVMRWHEGGRLRIPVAEIERLIVERTQAEAERLAAV
jgi:excisionase family DNA binding protein